MKFDEKMINKCRLCLNWQNNYSDFLSLDDNISIREKLESCVPEIDISLLKNSLICTTCSTALNNAFDFKCRCIESEKYIRGSFENIVNKEISLTANLAEAEGNCSIDIKPEHDEFPEPMSLAEDSALLYYSGSDHSPLSEDFVENPYIKPPILDQLNDVSEAEPLILNSDALGERELDLKHEHYEEDDVEVQLPTEVQCDEGHVSSLSDCKVILTRCDENQSRKDISDSNQFVCNICLKNYTCKRGLRAHYRIHTNPFTCTLCNAKFSRNYCLRKHAITHTGERPFPCQLCNLKYASNFALQNHVRIHHAGEKPYTCKLCDYRSGRKHLLKLHMKMHTKKRRYKCNLCDYVASEKCDLSLHFQVHLGELPYYCKFCYLQFSAQSHLDRHTRTHTGEKPFGCGVCGNRFIEKNRLVLHMRIHTGERPFACAHCDYRAARKCYLIKHLQMHTKGKPLCKGRFFQDASLTTHMGEKPIQCELCNGTCKCTGTPTIST